MAMPNIGMVAVSLGMPFVITRSSTAGSIIVTVGLALTAMGLQEYPNKVQGQ